MLLLGTFAAHLDSFVDSVWEQFCMKLIYSDEKKDQIIKITNDKFSEHSLNFEVKKEVLTSTKPKPEDVFRYQFCIKFLTNDIKRKLSERRNQEI